MLDGKNTYGITSIGTNPTVGGKTRTIETFFLDTSLNLYDRPIQLEFLSFLRGEIHFDTVEKLKDAIKEDEEMARAFIAKYE